MQQRHEVPQNFRRLLSSRLRRLVAQDKLEKVNEFNFKCKLFVFWWDNIKFIFTAYFLLWSISLTELLNFLVQNWQNILLISYLQCILMLEFFLIIQNITFYLYLARQHFGRSTYWVASIPSCVGLSNCLHFLLSKNERIFIGNFLYLSWFSLCLLDDDIYMLLLNSSQHLY